MTATRTCTGEITNHGGGAAVTFQRLGLVCATRASLMARNVRATSRSLIVSSGRQQCQNSDNHGALLDAPVRIQ